MITAAQASRRQAALERTICHDGEYMSRKSMMDTLMARGAVVIAHALDGRRISLPSGSFLSEAQVSKTAMDYAAGLLAMAKNSP